jgi:hypothetical protein
MDPATWGANRALLSRAATFDTVISPDGAARLVELLGEYQAGDDKQERSE